MLLVLETKIKRNVNFAAMCVGSCQIQQLLGFVLPHKITERTVIIIMD